MSKESVMSSLRICTDLDNLNVMGIQLSYYGFEGETALNDHGLMEIEGVTKCETKTFSEGEYIAALTIGYRDTNVFQVSFKTNKSADVNTYGFLFAGLETVSLDG